MATDRTIESTLAARGTKLLNTKRRIRITAIIDTVEMIEISRLAEEELL